jgi:hypothetical protein
VLIVLSIVGIGILGLGLKTFLVANPAADSIEFEVLSLEEIYPDALAEAVEWRSDAQLSAADFDFRPVGAIGQSWAALGFRSASSPQSWLNVAVIEDSEGLKYAASTGEFSNIDRALGEPISLTEVNIDSLQALEISLSNGGHGFILDRGDSMLWPQALFLRYQDDVSETGPIVWQADYLIPFVGPHIKMEIDAITGELVESTYREDSLLDAVSARPVPSYSLLGHIVIANGLLPANSRFMQVLGMSPEHFTNYEPAFLDALQTAHTQEYQRAIAWADHHKDLPRVWDEALMEELLKMPNAEVLEIYLFDPE